MPKRLQTTITERAGVNFVRTLVESQRSIFHEIEGRNDYGNDAIIQLVRPDGEVLPVYVMAQIKSGKSYVTAQTCALEADREHFRFWADHTTRVAGIVYDPAENAAYWVDIGQYLAEHPERVEAGPFTIRFAKDDTTRFDSRSFSKTFFAWAAQQPSFRLDRAVESLHSQAPEAHALGVYVLTTAFGCSAAAWDALFYAFEHRVPLSSGLVHAISMLGNHPDIFWRPGMIVYDQPLRSRLRKRLRDLSYDIVRRLVETIDEDGIERGTTGQSVEVVLHEHAAVGPHLLRVLREAEDPWIVECAAFLYAHLDPAAATVELVPFAASDETIAMLVEALRSGEGVGLY